MLEPLSSVQQLEQSVQKLLLPLRSDLLHFQAQLNVILFPIAELFRMTALQLLPNFHLALQHQGLL